MDGKERSAMYVNLIYLDTGEIFETDSNGDVTGGPVAILQTEFPDDALGTAMAAAPDLLKAAIYAKTLLEQNGIAFNEARLSDAITKAGWRDETPSVSA